MQALNQEKGETAHDSSGTYSQTPLKVFRCGKGENSSMMIANLKASPVLGYHNWKKKMRPRMEKGRMRK